MVPTRESGVWTIKWTAVLADLMLVGLESTKLASTGLPGMLPSHFPGNSWATWKSWNTTAPQCKVPFSIPQEDRLPGDPGRWVATCHDGNSCGIGPVIDATICQDCQLFSGRLWACFFTLLHFSYLIYKARIITPVLVYQDNVNTMPKTMFCN